MREKVEALKAHFGEGSNANKPNTRLSPSLSLSLWVIIFYQSAIHTKKIWFGPLALAFSDFYELSCIYSRDLLQLKPFYINLILTLKDTKACT